MRDKEREMKESATAHEKQSKLFKELTATYDGHLTGMRSKLEELENKEKEAQDKLEKAIADGKKLQSHCGTLQSEHEQLQFKLQLSQQRVNTLETQLASLPAQSGSSYAGCSFNAQGPHTTPAGMSLPCQC